MGEIGRLTFICRPAFLKGVNIAISISKGSSAMVWLRRVTSEF